MRLLVIAAVAALSLAPPPAGAPSATAPAPAASPETDRLPLPAPKPGRARPLVAIVAGNEGAETTDFTIPFGVLKESGVAEVRTLSLDPGPVQLMMALKVRADQTTAQFDTAEPGGADIVIVPAQMKPKDPRLAAWLRAQAAKGAVMVSICEGARATAYAGLLDGKRATTHWYALKGLEKAYPRTTWVRDRRYLQDARIISTTGVSASIPVSLALVEAIGGRAAAEATAGRIGVAEWGAAHRTADYRIDGGEGAYVLGSLAAVWTHETVEVPLTDGVDEVALALKADAWSRSARTTVASTGREAVRSRHGLVILPDAAPKAGRFVIPQHAGPAVGQLDAAIADMGRRYGPRAARFAQLTMEYDPPRR